MTPSRPLYDQLSRHSFEGALAFLASREGHADRHATNMLATMLAVLGAGAEFAALLKRAMPGALDGVADDIVALDSLAYVTVCLQEAARVDHQRHYADLDRARASVQLTSAGVTIRKFFLERVDPSLGPAFHERWKEFRAIETAHDRFHTLCYLLFTSRGHATPLHRYPNSPPLILDLGFGAESMLAELPCGRRLIDMRDAWLRIVAAMPDDEELAEETEAQSPPAPIRSTLETIEHCARFATICGDPLDEMRRFLRIALMARDFDLDLTSQETHSGKLRARDNGGDDLVRDLERALVISWDYGELAAFLERCRKTFA